MKNTFLLCLCSLMSAASLSANPTVLDSIAYTKWHKAEHTMLSENGQWVMYQYHYIKQRPEAGSCSFTSSGLSS